MTLETFARIAEFIGLAIAVVSFIYALGEGKKARLQAERASAEFARATSLVQEYERLVNEYRSRILKWSDMVGELANLVEQENKSIRIALDTLAYGAISVPQDYIRFWSNLLAKATAKVKIEIVTFDKRAQERMLAEQFGQQAAAAPTAEINAGLQRHQQCIQSLKDEGQGSTDVRLTSYFPLHLFVFESQKIAILALHTFSGGSVVTHAIKTSDPTLLAMCGDSFDRMRQGATAA